VLRQGKERQTSDEGYPRRERSSYGSSPSGAQNRVRETYNGEGN